MTDLTNDQWHQIEAVLWELDGDEITDVGVAISELQAIVANDKEKLSDIWKNREHYQFQWEDVTGEVIRPNWDELQPSTSFAEWLDTNWETLKPTNEDYAYFGFEQYYEALDALRTGNTEGVYEKLENDYKQKQLNNHGRLWRMWKQSAKGEK